MFVVFIVLYSCIIEKRFERLVGRKITAYTMNRAKGIWTGKENGKHVLYIAYKRQLNRCKDSLIKRS